MGGLTMQTKSYDFIKNKNLFDSLFLESQKKFHQRNKKYNLDLRERAFSEFWVDPDNFRRFLSYYQSKNKVHVEF